jgi:phenylalanyl-tRNA synthetase beta chain
MPTLTFNLKEVERFFGFKIDKNLELLEQLKIEADIDKKNNQVKFEFKDVNRPELFCVEILAKELKARLGKKIKEKGKIKKGEFFIEVDKGLKDIRPYILAIYVKNVKITEEFLAYLIQIQEILAENYGRKRKIASIGIYDFDKVNWPVYYMAVDPEAYRFVPLGLNEALTLKQILKKHEKGISYGYILEGFKKYPLLLDALNNVLSFPPIINSDYSGKVTTQTKNLIVEVTGTNKVFVNHIIDIFSSLFTIRGYDVYVVGIKEGKEKEYYEAKEKAIDVDFKKIKNIFGFDIDKKTLSKLASKFLAKVLFKKDKITFIFPFYRYDIISQSDVIEDLLIAYGYKKFKPSFDCLEASQKGYVSRKYEIYRKIANIMSCIAEEVNTEMLTSKEILEKAKQKNNFLTLANPISKNYECIRNYIFPNLLDFLSHNKNAQMPIKIFEIGDVINENREETHLAYLASSHNITFTNAKQDLEFLFRNLGINFEIEEYSNESFIEGRVAEIIVDKRHIGFIGEIHPSVLEAFRIFYPVVVFEINLDFLKDVKSF